jgi:hypothetical protein
LRRWVVAAAGAPDRVTAQAPSAARITAGSSRSPTVTDAAAAQSRAAVMPVGGVRLRAPGLNAQPNRARDRTFGSGAAVAAGQGGGDGGEGLGDGPAGGRGELRPFHAGVGAGVVIPGHRRGGGRGGGDGQAGGLVEGDAVADGPAQVPGEPVGQRLGGEGPAMRLQWVRSGTHTDWTDRQQVQMRKRQPRLTRNAGMPSWSRRLAPRLGDSGGR